MQSIEDEELFSLDDIEALFAEIDRGEIELITNTDSFFRLYNLYFEKKLEWCIWSNIIKRTMITIPTSIIVNLALRKLCVSDISHSKCEEYIYWICSGESEDSAMIIAKEIYSNKSRSVLELNMIFSKKSVTGNLFRYLSFIDPSDDSKKEALEIAVKRFESR